MTTATPITRLAKAIALSLAIAAFAVPAAQANDGLVDDWFRDAPSATQATLPSTYAVTDRLVDDYFRDANKVATPAGDRLVDDYFRDTARTTAPTADRIADDYFRDAPRTAVPADRIVDDWFRDPQVAAPLATAPLADRIVDDYFRDASRVAAPQPTASGFDWGDFGIGAAAMLGLVLLVTGLGLGALTVRHRGGQLGTS